MSSSLIPSLMAGNNIKNYERGSKLHQVKATTNSIHPPFNNNKNQNSVCTNGKNANEPKGQNNNNNSKIFHDFLIKKIIIENVSHLYSIGMRIIKGVLGLCDI